MKRLPIATLLIIVVGLLAYGWNVDEKYKGPKDPTTDLSWHPDVLTGYEARYVNLGEAFDGPCRCTIVRRLTGKKNRPAYLYIHGFNDYFFQSEMGKIFNDSGYDFYAVDLRRYGRSREPWQYPFNVRDMKEYFQDIDSALAQIRRDGHTDITLSGHSTGGLTVAYYAADRGKDIGVKRIVTNSPFLEWNYPAFLRNFGAPFIGFIGKITPNSKIKQGHCDAYAQSLLKEYHGQWTYNTDWKMPYSPPVTYSWIGAINAAQSKLMRKRKNIAVPILVMHSSRKISGCNWDPSFQWADCVLDPDMLQERGQELSNSTVCTIDSGIHDLILSEPGPRQQAYSTIFAFLRKHQTR